MSPIASTSSDVSMMPWLQALLGLAAAPAEGDTVEVRGTPLLFRGGILRSVAALSDAQAQTSDAFGFKWKKRDTFDSPIARARMHEWLIERYGDVSAAPWLTDGAIVLDAGCGAGWSALELFGPALARLRYLGVDVSTAVDTARERLVERGIIEAGFLQAELTRLPLPPASVDVILAEGVMHHTASTEGALKALAPLLKPDGRFLFYVYRRKGPVREFTDDYIRERVQALSPADAWRALEPLTRLGLALGALDAEIDIPEPIDLLGIPAGRINVQRLFYWHVAKAFYRPEFTFDEMNHINFDWYAPAHAHRQTPEDVRRWCADAQLEIEREVVEAAGITIVARRALNHVRD